MVGACVGCPDHTPKRGWLPVAATGGRCPHCSQLTLLPGLAWTCSVQDAGPVGFSQAGRLAVAPPSLTPSCAAFCCFGLAMGRYPQPGCIRRSLSCCAAAAVALQAGRAVTGRGGCDSLAFGGYRIDVASSERLQ